MQDSDNGEVLKANVEIDPAEIKLGMLVLGSDGEPIGKVKEVRAGDFLVDRPMARDVYVPIDRVVHVGLDEQGLVFQKQVQLDVHSSHVDEQKWEKA